MNKFFTLRSLALLITVAVLVGLNFYNYFSPKDISDNSVINSFVTLSSDDIPSQQINSMVVPDRNIMYWSTFGGTNSMKKNPFSILVEKDHQTPVVPKIVKQDIKPSNNLKAGALDHTFEVLAISSIGGIKSALIKSDDKKINVTTGSVLNDSYQVYKIDGENVYIERYK